MQKMFKKIKNFLIEKPNLGGKWMDLNYISNGMCGTFNLELVQSDKCFFSVNFLAFYLLSLPNCPFYLQFLVFIFHPVQG